jgi:small redox-active disulfide protein 2
MRIEIFGMGCERCMELERNVREAVRRTGIDAEVVKVADAAAIAAKGILSAPALAIDGKIVSVGRTLTVEKVIGMLKASHGDE